MNTKPFSNGQLIRFWVTYNLASSLAFMLQLMIKFADYEGWIVLLCTYLVSLVYVYFATRIVEVSPQGDLLQGCKKLLGWLYPIVPAFVSLFCIGLILLNLQAFNDLFGFVYLRDTPQLIISIIFMLSAAVVAQSGIKSIIYMSDGFFILLVISTVILLPMLLKNLQLDMVVAFFTRFQPAKIANTTFIVSNWVSDYVLIIFILSKFQTQGKARKTLAIANSIVIGLILVYWVLCILLFGPHLGGYLRYPVLELVRYFEIGEFLENADPVIVAGWACSLLLKTALLLYIPMKLLSSYFQLKAQVTRSIPFLLIVLIVITNNILMNFPSEFRKAVFAPYLAEIFFTFVRFIPIFLFILYKIRFGRQNHLPMK